MRLGANEPSGLPGYVQGIYTPPLTWHEMQIARAKLAYEMLQLISKDAQDVPVLGQAVCRALPLLYRVEQAIPSLGVSAWGT